MRYYYKKTGNKKSHKSIEKTTKKSIFKKKKFQIEKLNKKVTFDLAKNKLKIVKNYIKNMKMRFSSQSSVF